MVRGLDPDVEVLGEDRRSVALEGRLDLVVPLEEVPFWVKSDFRVMTPCPFSGCCWVEVPIATPRKRSDTTPSVTNTGAVPDVLFQVNTVLNTPLKLVTIALPAVVWPPTATPLNMTTAVTGEVEAVRNGADTEERGALVPITRANSTRNVAARTHPAARLIGATGSEVPRGG